MISHFNIVISSAAESDLTNILNYYVDNCKNPVGASKIARAIHEKIYSLSVFPSRGKTKNIHGQEIHSVSTGKFNIYFFIDELKYEVIVLRIFHSSRNIQKILRDMLIL